MNSFHFSRRQLLNWAPAIALSSAATARQAMAHAKYGVVKPPEPSPSMWLVKDDGKETDLQRHLQGRVSAVQLVFTKCRATCPIQAALFAEVARGLQIEDAQLLSLSIDPAIDKPAALRAWLDSFKAPRSWRAAAPRLQDVDPLLDFFRGRSQGADRHSSQVFFLDRKASLVLRSAPMPSALSVLHSLEAIARGV